jgi:uncharacterized protein with FMN-binding domain
MRRITLWLLSTVAALVLLFSYRTSTMGGPARVGAASGDSSDFAGTGSADTAAAGGGTTYQGSIAQTRWGAVQVSITVTDGKITSAAVPTYPNNNGRDREINSYALPLLRQETIAAQSADIDTVSGATVTSDGYKQSLQAALDAAHLS